MKTGVSNCCHTQSTTFFKRKMRKRIIFFQKAKNEICKKVEIFDTQTLTKRNLEPLKIPGIELKESYKSRPEKILSSTLNTKLKNGILNHNELKSTI